MVEVDHDEPGEHEERAGEDEEDRGEDDDGPPEYVVVTDHHSGSERNERSLCF